MDRASARLRRGGIRLLQQLQQQGQHRLLATHAGTAANQGNSSINLAQSPVWLLLSEWRLARAALTRGARRSLSSLEASRAAALLARAPKSWVECVQLWRIRRPGDSYFFPPIARVYGATSLFLTSKSNLVPKIMGLVLGEASLRGSARRLAHADQQQLAAATPCLAMQQALQGDAGGKRLDWDLAYAWKVARSPLLGGVVVLVSTFLETLVLLLRASYLGVLFFPAIVTGPLAGHAGGRYRRQWLRLVHRTLELAGPAFIKWGQWAATRPDLFPRDMCDELKKLHSKAPAHDFATTRKIVERAFGRPLEEVFAQFEVDPVASGSIAQVHRAVLRHRYPEAALRELRQAEAQLEEKAAASRSSGGSGGPQLGSSWAPRLGGSEVKARGIADDRASSAGALQTASAVRDEPSGSGQVVTKERGDVVAVRDGGARVSGIEEARGGGAREGSGKEVEVGRGEGEWLQVAVKVRHPGVREVIQRDFVIMNCIARASSLMPGLRWLRLEDSVKQFGVFMLAQVDLAREAAQLSRFSYNFRQWRSVSFPRPVYPLVHPQVLVESFERGESVARYVDRPVAHVEDPLNVELAKLGSNTLLKMLLVDNFVHADLHPGNILVRMQRGPIPWPRQGSFPLPPWLSSLFAFRHHNGAAGGTASTSLLPSHFAQSQAQIHSGESAGSIGSTSRSIDSSSSTPAAEGESAEAVGKVRRSWWAATRVYLESLLAVAHPHIILLDVGMTAELPPVYRSNMLNFFHALAVRDGRKAAECTLKFTQHQSCPDPPAFVEAVDASFKEWDATGMRVATGDCMQELLEQIRRHHVNIDGDVCTVIITTLVLESWQRKLDPNMSIMDTLRSILFRSDLASSLYITIGGLMAP